jgi:hypothetical protein
MKAALAKSGRSTRERDRETARAQGIQGIFRRSKTNHDIRFYRRRLGGFLTNRCPGKFRLRKISLLTSADDPVFFNAESGNGFLPSERSENRPVSHRADDSYNQSRIMPKSQHLIDAAVKPSVMTTSERAFQGVYP